MVLPSLQLAFDEKTAWRALCTRRTALHRSLILPGRLFGWDFTNYE